MFCIQGLDASEFTWLSRLSDEELSVIGARRCVVDAQPGFPDRIEIRDLEIGESAILLNYEHQPAVTPYRSRHAIFIKEGAARAANIIDTIPEAVKIRMISLRAFNVAGEIIDADPAEGANLPPLIEHFFANPDVSYLHVHYAKRGCYAARIVRA
ncbi:hypothetical protein AA23498_3509 [Acetobacter nitrogenifigens DSM 23921 = NBRC 105050]|uniref:DUF1203 domain-containing protein n=1 Tax=Acetobacter nitrogenifigens DSM 23921 = NBRC 105050 TaxID=1120919 RepID=A0A511XEK2_9PROT|nr:DUF1203 domain-containing protein [Acetobacter nitrogenifigens]GBQ99610.1 hypothetical protein AA23498_3509 [Acetobacter nitrogenifigens DSM 23921 = NBRC 105050]GEN61374.1 hypothetical protein ANI02nite_32580 [Acetobacter nitrogenifigens DSM 23921 = NBRC 105050]